MTVLSPEAEASVPPSGLNATLVHGVLVLGEGRAQPRARLGVPEDDGAVAGGGGERAAVGAERHARTRRPCARRGARPRVRVLSVPEDDGVVDGGGGERAAVGAERHAVHGVRVPGEGRAQPLARLDVPEDDGLVVGGGGERAAVGAERHAPHGGRVPGEGLRPAACAVLASQRMTVLSKEAEASVPPSGLNATPYTASVCPARGAPSACAS